MAIFHNQIDVVKALLKAGADPNIKSNGQDKKPPLFVVQPISIENDDYTTQDLLQLFKLLLQAGADPNCQNGDQEPLLYHVCENDEFPGEVVKILLDAGADPNVTDVEGLLPIHNVVSDDISDDRLLENQQQKLKYLLEGALKFPLISLII
mgnify:CR=1 FL=1